MSDLVKNLLNPDWVKEWFDQAGFQAAYRIEELIIEGSVMAQKLDSAEAKLAKAVEALTKISLAERHSGTKSVDLGREARNILAELKGQEHGN